MQNNNLNENINIERRVKINQMQRNVRRGKERLRWFRCWVRLFMIVVLIFAAYKVYKLPQWYLNKNIFSSASNNTLNIVGNNITPTYRIISVLRQYPVPQRPIYLFDTSKIEKEIEKLPPVKEVYIQRLWFPARLNIIIMERRPILSISPDPKVPPIAFFAEGGKLIGRDYLPLKNVEKTILVLTYGTKGDDYRTWDEKKIKKIETIVHAMEQFSGQKVEYIDLRNPKDIYIKLPEVNVRLGELDYMALSRVRNISAILPQIKTLNKKIKYIDLRWEDAQYIKLEE